MHIIKNQYWLTVWYRCKWVKLNACLFFLLLFCSASSEFIFVKDFLWANWICLWSSWSNYYSLSWAIRFGFIIVYLSFSVINFFGSYFDLTYAYFYRYFLYALAVYFFQNTIFSSCWLTSYFKLLFFYFCIASWIFKFYIIILIYLFFNFAAELYLSFLSVNKFIGDNGLSSYTKSLHIEIGAKYIL